MLRCRPTELTLTMPDIDHAFRRMAARQATHVSAKECPRVLRGAERSWEDAVTYRHHGFYFDQAGIASLDRPLRWPPGAYDSSATVDSDSQKPYRQEAESNPPRYRKDLSKLGVPATAFVDPATNLIRSFSTQLTLDGACDAAEGDHQQRPPLLPHQVHLANYLRDTPELPRSPLYQSHIIGSPESTQGPSNSFPEPDKRYRFRRKQRSASCSVDQSVDIEASNLTGKTTNTGNSVATASRFSTFPRCSLRSNRSRSEDAYHGRARFASSNNLDTTPANIVQHHSVQPPTRISSISTPNLTSRAVPSDITRLRNSSISANVNGFRSSSCRNTATGLPTLDLIDQHLSPLERLEQDACSEYSTAPSMASFHTTRTTQTISNVYFPSFGSPEKQESPGLPPYVPATPQRSSSSSLEGAKAFILSIAEESPSLMRLPSFELPIPDQTKLERLTDPQSSSPRYRDPQMLSNHGESPEQSSIAPGMAQIWRVPSSISTCIRNDSAVDLSHARFAQLPPPPPPPQPTIKRRTLPPPRHHSHLNMALPPIPQPPPTNRMTPSHRLASNPDLAVLDAALVPSGQRAQRPLNSPLSTTRTFAVFSPGLDGFGLDDLSRYPSPSTALGANRRSMPEATRVREHGHQPARRPERPYSHGARPRARRHVEHGMQHRERSRSFARPAVVDLTVQTQRAVGRVMPVWQQEQENDGAAEEGMMREEFDRLEVRMRGGENGASVGWRSVGSGGAVVLDDTPPREGRFERLMNEG